MLQPSGAALPLSLDAAMTMGEEQYDNIPDVGEKTDMETMNTNCIFTALLSFLKDDYDLGADPESAPVNVEDDDEEEGELTIDDTRPARRGEI